MELIHGECLEEMAKLPDGCVDMVMCDPPYGTTDCKWDSTIPIAPMWEQLKRVIKPNRAIVMTASQPFTTTLIASNMKMFKYCWVWEKSKGVGFLNAKNAPLKFHEDVCVFSEGATANRSKRNMPYNPQGLVEDGRLRTQPDVCESVGTRPCRKGNYVQTHRGYPTSIIKQSNDGNKLHPTQKPVALMEYLIKTYTNEGEMVLDFTMGSGTSGVACVNLNREFIGIERDDKYFEIAKNRIENAKTAQRDMFTEGLI
jgi:site-specific DNA-methyltransferase (adenine-specific)